METKTLMGDRNQCQGCKVYFNSTSAFEKHRVGEFGKDRRCRTEQEMIDIGMGVNQAGFWVGERWDGMPFAGQWQTPRSDLNGEVVPKHTPSVLGAEND